MIDINLAPPNLRRKQKRRILPKGFYVPPEVIIGGGGGLLLFLIVVHIFVIFKHISLKDRYMQVKKEWKTLLPAKREVDKIIIEIRKLQSIKQDVDKLIDADKILWSRKLNIISDSLPRGVWLRHIAFEDRKTFIIEGSAISRQQNQIAAIHEFTHNLRQQKAFLKHFQEMDIDSITRRKINNTEVVDFSIVASLKQEFRPEDKQEIEEKKSKKDKKKNKKGSSKRKKKHGRKKKHSR